MLRFIAGAGSTFLLMTGAFLIWQSHAEERPTLPDAPPPRAYSASMLSNLSSSRIKPMKATSSGVP